MAGRATKLGWVPNQHGAWAILLVPVILGMVRRWQAGGLPGWTWPMLGCWVVGYFAFFAVGLWLKAAPRRRPQYLPAIGVYGLVSALCGVVAVVWQGLRPDPYDDLATASFGWVSGFHPMLLWWALPFAPLVALTLWLTSRRHDRALASGVATVTASSLMFAVMRWTTPVNAWHGAGREQLLWLFLLGYFLGTLVYVKTMIRERGSTPWWVGSISWHALWLVGATVAGIFGWASAWWVAVFAVGLARAWALPYLAAAGRKITPKQVGIAEIALIALAITAALST